MGIAAVNDPRSWRTMIAVEALALGGFGLTDELLAIGRAVADDIAALRREMGHASHQRLVVAQPAR